ncbi:MAG: hypothetical protein ANABAC_1305 [Anaerolineae bacterium]|nr:MAG: hypothetical protein ANABAC_1305 [Anaerolineae bacterium]
MTTDLQAIIDALERARSDLNRIFVLVVERSPDGDQHILEWGMRSVSDLAAWIVVGSDKQIQEATHQ